MKKLHTYLFSFATKCSECGGVYRGIYENQKKYICSNYSNIKNKCSRRIIKESDIITMLETYCSRKNITIEHTPEFVVGLIDSIIIKDAENFDIYYKDGTHQFIHDNGIKFV